MIRYIINRLPIKLPHLCFVRRQPVVNPNKIFMTESNMAVSYHPARQRSPICKKISHKATFSHISHLIILTTSFLARKKHDRGSAHFLPRCARWSQHFSRSGERTRCRPRCSDQQWRRWRSHSYRLNVLFVWPRCW